MTEERVEDRIIYCNILFSGADRTFVHKTKDSEASFHIDTFNYTIVSNRKISDDLLPKIEDFILQLIKND